MMMAADGYYIYYGRDDEVIPSEVTRVRIDKSLAVIPARAFYENPNIEEVDCDNVETIEEYAFYYCPSLRLVIMRGVKVVEQFAFAECEALTDVECGKLEMIGFRHSMASLNAILWGASICHPPRSLGNLHSLRVKP